MADALSFDEQQGFSSAEVAFMQRLVGSEPDGEWGPNTVAAIETWQRARDIAPDGKVLRSRSGNTWPRMLAEGAAGWSAGGIERIALWTFTDALRRSSSESANDVQLAVDAKLTDVVFTITTDSNQSFALPSAIDEVVEIGQRYKDRGIDVGLNTFIFPSPDYVNPMADAVLEIHQRLGLRRLDIDAEELWIEHGNQASRDAAAELFGQRFADAGFAVAVNAIVFTSHAAVDPLVRQACVTHVTPQAYSVASMKTAAGEPAATYNPIDLQVTAAKLWSGYWPNRTMIGGFATFQQAGQYELGTLDEQVAIGLALRTWADLGVTEVSGWSIRNLSQVAAAVLAQRRC